MFRNYLIAAARSLRRHPGFSLLNVVGLAVGLTSCILILLYVRHERSFDRFHQKADRIVRAYSKTELGAEPNYGPNTAAPLGDFLMDTYPEVEDVSRVLPEIGESLVRGNGQARYEKGLAAADPAFFRIFDYRLIEGSATEALAAPYTAVLTPDFAARYFEDRDPVGETLEIEFWGHPFDFTVTGLVEAPPANSHLRFEALISYASYLQYQKDLYETDISGMWNMTNPSTYVLLRDGTDWRRLSEAVEEGVRRHVTSGEDAIKPEDVWFSYYLQPLTDIHLGTLGLPVDAEGNPATLKIFSLIAVLILLIACVNYMNLATARAARRAREIGVRKAFGARRRQLAWQFLSEAVFLALFACVLAVGLTEAAVPFFSLLTGGALDGVAWTDSTIVLGLLSAAMLAGLVSGVYPAAVLSRFSPVNVLGGEGGARGRGRLLRQALVVLQFTGGIGLILATLVVVKQMRFIHDTDLGFDRDQVVAVPLQGRAVQAKASLIREQFALIPGIAGASLGAQLPDRITTGNGIRVVGEPESSGMVRTVLAADPDYADVLGLHLVEGRWFDRTRPADSDAFVVNESAVSALGLEHPIGVQINRNGHEGPVIGVVTDFHFRSLHEKIQPLVIYAPEALYSNRYVVLKLTAGRTQETIEGLKSAWTRVLPDIPFSFTFLDERLNALYKSEQQQSRIFGIFAALGVFVACLGLFGLAAFTAEERTREIGIRKVLGASASSVTVLLSRDFLRLIVLAFCLAGPLAWTLMQRWLDGFAYRTHLGADIFLTTFVIAVTVAVFTVSGQALKAAFADPVRSIRSQG